MNENVLFVCTGNTCRSPMAMALYNKLTDGENSESRGLSVPFPDEAAENAKKAVERYGASLKDHISKQLTPEDLEKYSKIVTMTSGHKEAIKSVCNDEKVITLAEFAGESADVSDPYGRNAEVYEKTAETIFNYLKNALFDGCAYAGDKDLKSVADIEKMLFPDFWSENSISTQIKDRRVTVYKENGKVYGYCIFMTAADEGEILRIGVDVAMQGRGIGNKLLKFTINEMKENGSTDFFLEVRASNKKAISLYEKSGFRQIGVRKKYYTDNNEDAILYKKER